MSETPVEIPTSWWERLRGDRRRLAALIAAGVVLLVLLGMLVVRPLLGPDPRGDRDLADIELPRIDEGSGESTVAPGGDTTQAVGPDDPAPGGDDPATEPGGGDGDPSRPAADPLHAPYIAYRLAGSIVVAREDGSGPIEVVASSRGAFALSPDGNLLALVDDGELSIVTVADGTRLSAGPAESRGLAWRPDSRAVYVMRLSGPGGSSEVWRVSAVDGAPSKVVSGGPAAVAFDGTVAVPPVPTTSADPGTGTLWILPGGAKAREIRVQGQLSECAAEAGSIVYAVHGSVSAGDPAVGSSAEPEIRVMRYDGSGDRRLLGPPASQRPFGYGSLILSPDGTHLLFAEVGDDGYSRAFVLSMAGGTPRALTVRRDTYPFGWSADGARVLFVEGNAFQGEPTSLFTARLDGTGRRMLVDGAGM